MADADPRRSSPFGPLAGLAGTLALLAWIGLGHRVERTRPIPMPSPPSLVEVAPIVPEAREPAPVPAPKVVEPDREAVSRAEAGLDEATRARAVAESRLADAEIALRKATLASAADAAEARGLAFHVRDPSARIERATNRATRAKWEAERLRKEADALAQAPRPKAQPLRDKGAVAMPVDGKEYHFEVRGDRVAFIDIDKLTEMVKAEVRLRVRMNLRNRAFDGVVGPVGDFSMKYEMSSALPDAVADLLDRREVTYQLRGWEIEPDRPVRGETYETAWTPGASFSRAIGRLNPERASVTLWIYPDGFALYRRLRDDLHARGFLVSARPLPEGMAIRGSPGGSLSAGQ